MDPDAFGPVRAAIAVALFAAMFVFTLVLAPLPALIAGSVGGGVAFYLIRRNPMTWEQWCEDGYRIAQRTALPQTLFAAACFLVAALAEPLAIKGAALALVIGPCLVFSANGLRLLLDYRRRRRPLRP